MTNTSRRRRGPAVERPAEHWLVDLAGAAARDAGNAPAALLGDYLPLLAGVR
ncbi:hypothetical protein GCM10009557_56410 [Virgisporangium ochraceum]